MKLNTPLPPALTHEGGRATRALTPIEKLERAVATCLLWENSFYEKGSEIAARIQALVNECTFAEVAAIAIRARNEWKLRHAPLFLVACMARKRAAYAGQIEGISIIGDTLTQVIQRPDELAEFLSIYWREGKRPLSAQVKRGLANAFPKFSRFALSKWNRDGAIKLRDVLFLSHARPKDVEQGLAWQALIDGTLEPADTWEVALSAGADKQATFERLLREGKLGYMALLMNLRNMLKAGVRRGLILKALLDGAPNSRALPFRFVTAAKHAPGLSDTLDQAMLAALPPELGKSLKGETFVLVDVSGSMDDPLSAKSQTTRLDAACGVAILAREMCEDARVFTFSNGLTECRNYRGLPLAEAIRTSQPHVGTYLGTAIKMMYEMVGVPHRLIVVTDEQAHDALPPTWNVRAYIMNVASYAPALPAAENGYIRINGWSEHILKWIVLDEALSDLFGGTREA